jgi:ribose-phosphate pyrophosphokinase
MTQEFNHQRENKEILRDETVIIAGNSNPELAIEVGSCLSMPVDFPSQRWGDDEAKIQIKSPLRRKHVFILQSGYPEPDKSIIEMLLMIDAAKRASAAEITAFISYFPYARMDRKSAPRVPISAAAIVNFLERAGANRIATLSLHAEQTMGVFPGPWDNLFSSYSLLPRILNLIFEQGVNPKNIADEVIVFSPDAGGVARARFYAELIGCPYAVLPKSRDVHTIRHLGLMTGVPIKGRVGIVIDDLIASARTICDVAPGTIDAGLASLHVAAEHGQFIDGALERISASPIARVITTNTIRQPLAILQHPKIEVVSVAPLIAQAIEHIHLGTTQEGKLIF